MCSDLPEEKFSLGGGCADKLSATHSFDDRSADSFGHDCSWYDSNAGECGKRDDSDFNSSDLCCACGGGHQNLPSSQSCWDSFTDRCWLMPQMALAWLLYVKGLVDYSLSQQGFESTLANVVGKNYPGITWALHDLINVDNLTEHFKSGMFGRDMVSGTWRLMPGLAHPRGKAGCSFLASFEVRSLLNVDLCSDGEFTPIRSFCPIECGCGTSHSGLDECPAPCILQECLQTEDSLSQCLYSHPWFNDECLNGYHNDEDNLGVETNCRQCKGGETRRRRATACTGCPPGRYDNKNRDDCMVCEGETRRRRSDACTKCPQGRYPIPSQDHCTAVTCPANSQGDTLSGCECDKGLWGTIRATTESPYLEGVCLEPPTFRRTDGKCLFPILDAGVCQLAGRKAASQGDVDFAVSSEKSLPPGCAFDAEGRLHFNEANSLLLCTSEMPCLCLGDEELSTCTDVPHPKCRKIYTDFCERSNHDSDFSPLDMCCVCGGGVTKVPVTRTATTRRKLHSVARARRAPSGACSHPRASGLTTTTTQTSRPQICAAPAAVAAWCRRRRPARRPPRL
jgi:hypothetical protein